MSRVKIFPLRCAMHGAINIRTDRWGYICFKPPTYVFGQWWGWYFYLSPNATPWASTLLWGKRAFSSSERMMARVRKALWGHGYSENHDPQDLNSYFDTMVNAGVSFQDESTFILGPDDHQSGPDR